LGLLEVLRCYRLGRIEAYPALAVYPNFDPGVGVGLIDLQEAATGVDEPSQITGYDPSRNAGSAH